MRFLSTIFFGETDEWFITPLGDAHFRNLTAGSGTFSSVTTDYLTVTRSETIAGLNADFLDGQDGSYYLSWNNFTEKPVILSSLDNVSNNEGNIDLIAAGGGITITPNDTTNTITFTVPPPPAFPQGSGSGNDADTLDSLDSTQFLRSDTSDSFTSGTLTFNSGTTLSLASGSTLTVAGGFSSGTILPLADDTYDLGSTSLRWRDLYLGPTSLHIIGTAAETTTARDWKLAIQETDGVSEGNLRIIEGTSGTEALNITPTGNVGIGTTAPSSALTVRDNSSARPIAWERYISGVQSGKTWAWEVDASATHLRNVTDVSIPITFLNGGNVGIGTTSILGKVNIQSADSGVATVSGAADELVIEGSGNSGISILTPNTANAQISFGDPQDNNVGNINYLHSENRMQFRTAGLSTGLDIDSSGNVGIGTTVPDARLLVVGTGDQVLNLRRTENDTNTRDILQFQRGDGTGEKFTFLGQGDGSNGYSKIRVDSTTTSNILTLQDDGNVGIGTTNPGALLSVDSNGGIVSQVNIRGFAASTTGSGINFYKTRSAVNADTQVIVNSGDDLTTIRFHGSDGSAYQASAQIKATVDAAPGAGNVPGRLSFYTIPSGGGSNVNNYERMRIDSLGNIGIGTTNLDEMVNLSKSDGTAVRIRFERTGSTENDWEIGPGGSGIAGDFIIKGGDDSADPTEAVRIVGGGDRSVLPGVTNAQNLGSSSKRWGCLWYNNASLGTCASDQILKTNISSLDFGDALGKLVNLKLRTFEFKDDPNHQTTNGLIAQEVLPFAPELVSTGSDGFYKVDYGALQYLTIQAVQQLDAKVKTDEDRIAALESEDLAVDNDGELADENGKIKAETVEAKEGIFETLTSTIEAIFAQIKAQTLDVAGKLTAKTAEIAEAVIDNLTVKRARANELEMVDRATGEIYCTWVENGEWNKQLGECPTP